MVYFCSQNRWAVTKEDYIVRVYSLPQKYGVIKCFIVQDEQLEVNTQTIMKQGKIVKQPNTSVIPNPLALNMYVLGYDGSNHLVALNEVVKQNLRVYLSQYRLVTDVY